MSTGFTEEPIRGHGSRSTSHAKVIGLATLVALLILCGLAAALFAIAAFPQSIVRSMFVLVDVDRTQRVPSAETLSRIQLIAGALGLTCLAVAVAGLRARKRISEHVAAAFPPPHAPPRPSGTETSRLITITRWDVGILIVMMALGAVMRITMLQQPPSYDEAITYVTFVSRSLLDVLSDYRIPNNHVLHNVLAWISVKVFGTSLVSLRLPALLAGVLVIPATFWTGRQLVGGRAALFAAGFVSVAPAFVEYSAQARGYTLLALLFVIGLGIAARLSANSSLLSWIVLALVFALGGYTIPTAAYGVAVTLWWVVLSGRRGEWAALARRLTLTVTITGAVTALLYTPVILRSGLSSLIGNRYVSTQTWAEVLQRMVRGGTELWECWTGRLSLVGVLILLGVLAALATTRRNDTRAARLLAAILLGVFSLIIVQRVAPQPRMLHFLLTVVAMVVAFGLHRLVMSLGGNDPRRVTIAWAVISLLLPLAWGIQRLAYPEASYSEAVRSGARWPGQEGVNCCAEGYFVDADTVARTAVALLGPGDVIITHRYAGMATDVQYYLVSNGHDPALIHPLTPSRGLALLNGYRRVYALVRADTVPPLPPLEHVLHGLEVPADEYEQAFAPPELVSSFRISRLYRLR